MAFFAAAGFHCLSALVLDAGVTSAYDFNGFLQRSCRSVRVLKQLLPEVLQLVRTHLTSQHSLQACSKTEINAFIKGLRPATLHLADLCNAYYPARLYLFCIGSGMSNVTEKLMRG